MIIGIKAHREPAACFQLLEIRRGLPFTEGADNNKISATVTSDGW
jgi:hypothetical protein